MKLDKLADQTENFRTSPEEIATVQLRRILRFDSGKYRRFSRHIIQPRDKKRKKPTNRECKAFVNGRAIIPRELATSHRSDDAVRRDALSLPCCLLLAASPPVCPPYRVRHLRVSHRKHTPGALSSSCPFLTRSPFPPSLSLSIPVSFSPSLAFFLSFSVFLRPSSCISL